MAAENVPQLTKEQLARFNMPYQEVLSEHWNKIPEVVLKSSTVAPVSPQNSGSLLSDLLPDLAGFLGKAGQAVGNAFSSIGLGLHDTLTNLIFLLLVILALVFLVRRLFYCHQNSHQKCQTCSCDSSPRHQQHHCSTLCKSTALMDVV